MNSFLIALSIAVILPQGKLQAKFMTFSAIAKVKVSDLSRIFCGNWMSFHDHNEHVSVNRYNRNLPICTTQMMLLIGIFGSRCKESTRVPVRKFFIVFELCKQFATPCNRFLFLCFTLVDRIIRQTLPYPVKIGLDVVDAYACARRVVTIKTIELQ